MALLKGFQAFLCNKQKMAASGMKMAANLLENGRDEPKSLGNPDGKETINRLP